MNYIVVDLGFGDQGKGSVTDFLCRETGANLVVRYNGGAQAAHNVIDETGRHHCFAQFGSGTLAGASTLLSRFMLLNPLTMQKEAERLCANFGFSPAALWQTVHISDHALVINPYLRALNCLRELARGSDRHGSCGMGVGETHVYASRYPADAIRVADIRSTTTCRNLLLLCRSRCLAAIAELDLTEAHKLHPGEVATQLATANLDPAQILERYRTFTHSGLHILNNDQVKEMTSKSTCVFEGAQGVLLDERYGFHPYTTWSDTTTTNALKLLTEADCTDYYQLGVLRAYATRHGPGPFPTHDIKLSSQLCDEHNTTQLYQREFRVGWFDVPLTRYALECNGKVDGLALTHMDCLIKRSRWNVATEYSTPLHKPDNLLSQAANTQLLADLVPHYEQVYSTDVVPMLESALNLQIAVKSHGPRADQKHCLLEVVA